MEAAKVRVGGRVEGVVKVEAVKERVAERVEGGG